MPITGGDLEALVLESDRAVGAALTALDLDAERGAQCLTRGALTSDIVAGEIPLKRWATDLLMPGAIVFLGHPGKSGEIELIEREVWLTLEHRQQSSLDLGPPRLLLSVHMGGPWPCWNVHDA